MTRGLAAGATVLIMVRYRQPGLVFTDRTFTVPLDHAQPDGEQISIFAREVVATASESADLPWLVFFQGGPGFGSPRPVGRADWLDRALREFRVLLLDQRGTGRSTPATRQTLSRFPADAAAVARYLGHFRADSIVADAELIRPQITGGAPWSVLGQSFGGFCAVTYLSRAPGGLREAFITGGLPGLTATADDVYRLTYQVVAAKNQAHYRRYPQDVDIARQVARELAARPATLPGGGTLTVERFQTLGQMLGSGTGSHSLHYLLENPFVGSSLSDAFLAQVQEHLSYASAPLYALVHEACYAQGVATRWSAQRVRTEFPAFAPAAAIEGDGPLLFTGEMVYPSVFEHDPALQPLAAAADLLAERSDWPALYDPSQLASNDIPVAAAIYFDDMYVPRDLSLATAAGIRGLRYWITNEFEHDGLRTSEGRVLDRLIALARDTA
jgi:pimeloyl-ACP methyl ester carboxylesterase